MSNYGGWAGTLRLNASELSERAAAAFKHYVRQTWDEHVSLTLNQQATELTVSFDLEADVTGADMCAVRNHLNNLAAFMPLGDFVETWWEDADDPEPTREWFGPAMPDISEATPTATLQALANVLALDLDWNTETCHMLATLLAQAGYNVEPGSLRVDADGRVVPVGAP